MRRFILGLMAVLMITVGPATAQTCDDQCIAIIEVTLPLQEQLIALQNKFPGAAAKEYMLQVSGIDPQEFAKKESGQEDLAAYYAAKEPIMRNWQRQMEKVWNGPRSKNPRITRRMFEVAVERCSRLCLK